VGNLIKNQNIRDDWTKAKGRQQNQTRPNLM